MKTPLILIVDDTLKNIQLLGAILKKAAYDISIATSGKQALSLLESVTPDLILLDVMMPDMDGYEVCKTIKKIKKLETVPVIFLTGKTDTDDIVKAFEVGASDYVMKPYKTAELLARVGLQLDLKFARDELKASNDELARMNKDKDQFLSIISHDLRSPFQGILGLSGLLKTEFDTFSPEDRMDIVELLDSSLNSVYKLIENLLSWSLVEMGKYKLYATRINVLEVANSQLQLYKIQLKDKSIVLNVNIDDSLDLVTDEQGLSTVIRNLFSNAVKFTPEGGSITVSAGLCNDSLVSISVIDTGPGISEEIINRVLGNDDMRLKSLPGTNSEQGSGIGLLLSRELIHLMGGKLEIISKGEKGSEFKFYLPPEMRMAY
jgi:two-component system sensor histidine kinase/response regulator